MEKKTRKRRSPVWFMPETEFRTLVQDSKGVGQVLKAFNLENKGRNHHTVQQRIRELGIDTSHFDLRYRSPSVHKRPYHGRPLVDVLVVNSRVSGSVKHRMIKEGLLSNLCAICGCNPEWFGRPLVLVLDHINGDHLDSRIENLRLLCPNCNSQTSTFAGRNNKPAHKQEIESKGCPVCGVTILPGSKSCTQHQASRYTTRWPNPKELLELVSVSGNSAVARTLGVSETAVRKKLKRNSIRE